MGLDFHGTKWIQYSLGSRPVESLITLGRQSINISADDYHALTGVRPSPGQCFADDLLARLSGAAVIKSLDFSDYEGADIVADLNVPLPSELSNKFDVVIDGGTTEHVYNVAIALENCSRLCKPGGQIIHILPADNFNGHGFWQFSAELFFSLYSSVNGYEDTEVVFVCLNQRKYWYRVNKPRLGRRVHLRSSSPVHVMVKTRKMTSVERLTVMQSDYVAKWENELAGEARLGRLSAGRLTAGLRHAAISLESSFLTRPLYTFLRRKSQELSIFNQDMSRIRLRDI
jgi:SAM-dependent methyltransferase